MRQTLVFRLFRRLPLVLLALAGLAAPALAHPHVLVSARAALIFDASGKLTGIRHKWTFDEAYSAFATTGMKRGKDGKVSSDDLKDLSKLNVESLNEFNYFTTLKQGRTTYEFTAVPDGYFLEDDGKALTLNFVLPLKAPVAPQTGMSLRIDDESLFVAFSYPETTPITLEGQAGTCKIDIKRPKKQVDTSEMSKLGEDFFNNIQAGFADQYTTSIRLNCP